MHGLWTCSQTGYAALVYLRCPSNCCRQCCLCLLHVLQTLVELQGLLDRCPAAIGMADQVIDMRSEDDVAQLRAVPGSVQNHVSRQYMFPAVL